MALVFLSLWNFLARDSLVHKSLTLFLPIKQPRREDMPPGSSFMRGSSASSRCSASTSTTCSGFVSWPSKVVVWSTAAQCFVYCIIYDEYMYIYIMND